MKKKKEKDTFPGTEKHRVTWHDLKERPESCKMHVEAKEGCAEGACTCLRVYPRACNFPKEISKILARPQAESQAGGGKTGTQTSSSVTLRTQRQRGLREEQPLWIPRFPARSRLFHTECFVRGKEEKAFAFSCYHLTAALDLGTFCLKRPFSRELDATGAELYCKNTGHSCTPPTYQNLEALPGSRGGKKLLRQMSTGWGGVLYTRLQSLLRYRSKAMGTSCITAEEAGQKGIHPQQRDRGTVQREGRRF